MRTTNLIQTYIAETQNNPRRPPVKDFDIHRELSNRTFIKPLPSNGKLLTPSIMDIPSEIKKDIKYDIKALGHAIKGEANDHELGRLNDVGMKFGGLAIATYLFSKKQTPMTKIFEFVGLGTFLGAMEIWPKLFIQLPAKLIHGVDVRQQYEDSFGRKKMFYQDHQFIPWDLYSDEEINKIGDKLGVSKNIPNRREFIQEKMRKIALQNNTLWMLTAGVATPLMSALMCNALEKPMSRYMGKQTDLKAEALMTNFTREIGKYDFSEKEKELENILKSGLGKPLTKETVDEIAKNITRDMTSNVLVDAVKKDLSQMMPVDGKYILSESGLNKIREIVENQFKKSGLDEKELAKIVPNADLIKETFNSQNLLNGEFREFSEHTKALMNLLESRIADYTKENPDPAVARRLNFLQKELVSSPNLHIDSELQKVFKQQSAANLTPELCEVLKEVSKSFNKFSAGSSVLDKYSFMKVAQAPETSLANSWNEMSEALFKSLNFTPSETEQARLDGEVASEILRNKLETITSSKESYTKFINDTQKAISDFHGKIEALGMTQSETSNNYKSNVKSTYDEITSVLNKFGMHHSTEALTGYPVSGKTSTRELMYEFITDRVKGVKSSFYRFLDLADMYYRISKVEGVNHVLTPQMPREVKEETVELAKQVLLDGHTADFANKFHQKRNPQPNKVDYSQIETVGGKVINKYFGKNDPINLCELSNDRFHFENVMKLMFGGDIHKDTDDIIRNTVFYDDFKKYRSDVLHILGGDYNFSKPNFLVDGVRTDSSSEAKFLLMGSSPSEMALKHCNNAFNSGKWFTMFGKLGAGLAAITVLAQFFFGYMKKPEEVNKS